MGLNDQYDYYNLPTVPLLTDLPSGAFEPIGFYNHRMAPSFSGMKVLFSNSDSTEFQWVNYGTLTIRNSNPENGVVTEYNDTVYRDWTAGTSNNISLKNIYQKEIDDRRDVSGDGVVFSRDYNPSNRINSDSDISFFHDGYVIRMAGSQGWSQGFIPLVEGPGDYHSLLKLLDFIMKHPHILMINFSGLSMIHRETFIDMT